MHSFTNHSWPDVFDPLPISRREQVEGWARMHRASSYVWRPTTVDEVREVLALARSHSQTVVLRGGGHSYADAALNTEGITVNLSQMRRVLAWDPQQGIIRVEAGMTIGDLWRTTIADGWWPEIAPSTMEATIAGCLAMNAHGTNAWEKGSMGEQVLALDLLLASGDLITVTPAHDPDLFHALIGGLGMIGIITSITLRLRPIQSGKLLVHQRPARSLSDMFTIILEETPAADYLEGWIDGYSDNHSLGRGLVRYANLIDEPDPHSLHPRSQVSQSKAGIIPFTILRWAARPFLNIGTRISNTIRYTRGVLRGSRRTERISLAQFLFHSDSQYRALHALLPLGFCSIQPFIPAEHALAVFIELLERSHQAGIRSAWCILKRCRSGLFLLSPKVDGFSLELNFPATIRNASKLAMLLAEMRETVIAAGGHLYLAKDDILDSETFAQSMGMDRIERFLAIKHAYDPEGLFQSDLFRRLFAQRIQGDLKVPKE